MDAVFNALVAVSLVGVVAYAFCVYQVLRLLVAWGRDRWRDDWGRRPLLLRLPSRAVTLLLVLVFLAVAL